MTARDTDTKPEVDEEGLIALVDDDIEGEPDEVMEEGGDDTDGRRPWHGLVEYARSLVPETTFENRRGAIPAASKERGSVPGTGRPPEPELSQDEVDVRPPTVPTP